MTKLTPKAKKPIKKLDEMSKYTPGMSMNYIPIVDNTNQDISGITQGYIDSYFVKKHQFNKNDKLLFKNNITIMEKNRTLTNVNESNFVAELNYLESYVIGRGKGSFNKPENSRYIDVSSNNNVSRIHARIFFTGLIRTQILELSLTNKKNLIGL